MAKRRTAVDESVRIDRPVDHVWAVLADWSLAHEWLPGVTNCDGSSRLEAGDEVRFQFHDTAGTAFVAIADARRRLVVKRMNGPVAAVFDYTLVSHGVSTVVRLMADIETESLVRLARRPLRKALANSDRGQLLSLKEYVERS